MVKAQARHDSGEPCREVVDDAGAGEPKPGLLKDILGIGL
jgi:hypothetical protein